MNLYNAIMRAADHIERHPEFFYFNECRIPECGTPGCALGWIAHFMGQEAENVTEFAARVLPVGEDWRSAEGTFYDRIDLVLGDEHWDWITEAAVCAKGLRLYAEKYHGHEKPRPTSAMVADLLARVTGPRILDEVEA